MVSVYRNSNLFSTGSRLSRRSRSSTRLSKTNSTTNNITNYEIGMFSFNLGDFNKHSEYHNEEKLFNDFSKIFNKNKNKIWIISTQEDDANSVFCNTLQKYFEQEMNGGALFRRRNKYKQLNSNSYNTTDNTADKKGQYSLLSHNMGGVDLDLIIKTIKYKVHLMIFVPTHLLTNNQVKVLSETTIKHFKATKASVITTFQIQLNDKSNPTVITAIGSHLPIKTTEDIALGYTKRNESVLQTLTEVNNIIGKLKQSMGLTNANFHILWTGDLNFRLMNYQNKNSDQLKFFISSQKSKSDTDMPIKIEDLTGIENFGPTCKTTAEPSEKDNCISDYKQSSLEDMGDVSSKCYDVITKKVNNISNRDCGPQYVGTRPLTKECVKKFDENKQSQKHKKSLIRYPSYCDRVLGWSSGEYKLVVAKDGNVRPVTETEFFKISDHNPIVGNFTFAKHNKTPKYKNTLISSSIRNSRIRTSRTSLARKHYVSA